MNPRKAWPTAAVLLLLSLALLLVGASIGSTGLDSLLAARHDPVALQILWDIRLPRSLGAWLAGALFALAGAVAQGLFRNPLADPYLLGSASGASLAIAVALALLGVSPVATAWLLHLGLTGAAFAGAVGGVLLTLLLARGVQHTLRMLLAGVIVGVVLGAARDLVLQAEPSIQNASLGFSQGSTAFIAWSACALMAGVWLLCLASAWALAPVLDGLSLGESTAQSLGLPLPRARASLIAVLALATGTAVAQSGMIAFVGLVAPHLARSLLPTTHGRWMVLSSLTGGVLLLAADILARWLIAPQELPVGVLTAALGGCYLLWRMHKRTAGAL